VGLRTGTPDAEAISRHVVHAWILIAALTGGAPSPERRPFRVLPGVETREMAVPAADSWA